MIDADAAEGHSALGPPATAGDGRKATLTTATL